MDPDEPDFHGFFYMMTHHPYQSALSVSFGHMTNCMLEDSSNGATPGGIQPE